MDVVDDNFCIILVIDVTNFMVSTLIQVKMFSVVVLVV